MSLPLKEIHRIDWPKLRDLFVGEGHTYAFNTIQCFIDWMNHEIPGVNLGIFTLDDQWEVDGTYAAVNKESPFFVFCETRSEDMSRLDALLGTLNKILSPNTVYFGFPERLRTTVIQNCYNHGFLNTNLEGAYLFYIEKEKAQQFRIAMPPGFTMQNLRPEDVDHVVNTWPRHTPGQVNNAWPEQPPDIAFYVRLMIACSDNVAMFDSEGRIVGWSLRSIIGTIGLVEVVNPYEYFGFDMLIVQYMAKLLAEKNIEVTAHVDFHKIEMYNKLHWLGFHVIDTIYGLEKVPSEQESDVPPIDEENAGSPGAIQN